ncbi:MAG: ABC transporter substrate-binding protein [Minwuia sp.]|uniref:ABC transporter substrate-binding protein n=1 Tax=Minwuia sp. TaxID=2493630 RepID=UPI003A8429F9
MKTRKHLVAGVAAALALAGAAIPAAADDKTLVVALETDLRGFEALKANVLGISASAVMAATTERLAEWDGKGGAVPQLATSWEIAPDGTSITYQLRQGVKFHNGDDFTARDVAEHWNRLMDPANKYFGRLFYGPVKNVVADGDHTVTFQLAHPWVPAETMHGSYSFGSFVPSSRNVNEEKQMRHPVGTGPFKFSEWRSGDRLIVDRNPDYWDADRVKLDRVVFRVIPDQATRFAALQSGEVDMIWTDRGDTILKAEKDDRLVVNSRVGAGTIMGFLNNAKPPFDDVDARRAFQHAWDQKAYLKVSYKDTVPAIEHPLGPDVQCDAGYRDHDTAKAKELAAAYEAKHGKPLDFEVIHTSTQRGREYGEITQQLMRRAGMTASLTPVDQLQLRQRVFTNNYNVSGWRIADTGDVGPQLFALLHSKSPYNLAKYVNPAMDELVVKMRVAPTQDARNAAMCDVIRLMNDEVPIFYTGGRKHYVITSKSVKGQLDLFQGVPDVRYLWKETAG